MPDKNTLGFDDDLDFGEMVLELEKTFGVTFGRMLPWVTVGDVHTALLEQVSTSNQPGKCATSMAFYRLRQALLSVTGTETKIVPRTYLRDLTNGSAKVLHKQLSLAMGLRLPAVRPGVVGTTGGLMLLAGILGAFCAAIIHGLWPCVALAPIGFVLARVDPGSFGSQTVGELARKIAAGNFQAFARAGADRRPDAIWITLVELLGEIAENAPTRITRDTRLLV